MLDSDGLCVQALPSVVAVARPSWDALFANSAFGWAFCKAGEAAPPVGFTLSAIGVFDGAELLAAAQLFHTSQRLDMPLPAPLRSFAAVVYRLAPKLVKLPLTGLGSPLTDRCHVGFSPRLGPEKRAHVWQILLAGFEYEARRRGAHLFVVKDLADVDRAWAQPALAGAHFTPLASLPVAVLDLPFARLEDYLASLSSSMRSDIRRKLRQSADKVRFEVRNSTAGIEAEIATLYEATRAHRRADFGEYDSLSPEYFGRLLEGLGERAKLTLGWIGDQLASFDLFLVEPDRVVAHQIGMRYPLARQHNLYFLNWMRMVRFCLERGVTRLEMGQTAYLQKLRLGCRLEKTWVYFKHWLRPINAVMRIAAPLAALNKLEPGATE